jgi:lipoprotein
MKSMNVISSIVWIFMLSSCSFIAKECIQDGWLKESLINYHSADKIEVLYQIDQVFDQFDKAISYNKKNWSSGYFQKTQFARKLYFISTSSSFIYFKTKKEFINYICTIYQDWFLQNPNDIQHCVPYAMTLYLCGEFEKMNELLHLYYNPDLNYNAQTIPLNDFYNFIAGYYLGLIDIQKFKNTDYERFFNLDDEDILVTFVGF